MTDDGRHELEVARDLARRAGNLAMAKREAGFTVDYKNGDTSNPVTSADREANELIVEGLQRAFPQDAILAEESADDAAGKTRRSTASRLWCVDPIDGTREYVAKQDQFAVMIGLAKDGAAHLGVVYHPPSDTMLWGSAAGAFVQSGKLAVAPTQVSDRADGPSAIAMISRSHPSRAVLELLAAMQITQHRPMGSVGLKMAEIALGRADVYISMSAQTHEWDACAPEAILRAAGGQVSDACGEPLRYNKADTITPRGILATNRHMHPMCVQALVALAKKRRW